MKKLFGTDGIRGVANVYPMTPEMVLKVGKAVARIFRSQNGKKTKILIGKDTRLSGYMLESALVAGIVSEGADVLLVGPMPTPAIAHLTKSFAADAGIVISASHNSAQDNGIKIFSADGYKLPDDMEEEIEKLIFREYVNKDEIINEKIGRAVRIDDARGRYIEFAKSSISNHSLKGLKIVLDCANGAAYKTAPYIFEELGAEVIVLNNKPDGLNINEDCGALHPEKIKDIVRKEKADIGILLDGDADRIITLDENGEIVNGDHLIAIFANFLKSKNALKNDTVVVTQMSNLGFDKCMKRIGVNVKRTDVGDRYVLEAMKECDYILGGEQSGHIIFKKHSATGDGTIAGLQICDIMAKQKQRLSELSKIMEDFPQVLVNVKVKSKIPFDDLPKTKKALAMAEEELEGKGRVFMRYSGTENLCRIMLEGESKSQIDALSQRIADEVRKENGA